MSLLLGPRQEMHTMILEHPKEPENKDTHRVDDGLCQRNAGADWGILSGQSWDTPSERVDPVVRTGLLCKI